MVPENDTQGWTYSAGVDVSETYDTAVPINSNGNQNLTVHDLITRLTPSLGVTGDSARLSGNLFYGPTIQHLHDPRQPERRQPEPQRRGAGDDNSRLLLRRRARVRGGAGDLQASTAPAGTTTVASSNAQLSTSFSISPTLHHSFGSVADASLSYTLSHTGLNANNQVPTATAQTVNQNYTTQAVDGSVSTGSDFGQFNDAITAQAGQSSGTGPLHGASEDYVFENTASYALSRSLTLTASIDTRTTITAAATRTGRRRDLETTASPGRPTPTAASPSASAISRAKARST